MQTILLKITLAVALAALTSAAAFAQQAAPAGQPTPPAYQQGVLYPGQPQPAATPAGNQQGSVYPGQPIAYAQGAPAASPPPHGRAPTLPPLPGASLAELTPAQQAVDDTMPADAPAAVLKLRRRVDKFQEAGSRSLRAAPIPVARSIDLTQAPGETPPVLRVTMGMPTNLVFMDASGAPWPISYVTPGAPGQFDTLIPEAGSASVQILPKDPYAYGGFSVKLVDNPIPVSIIVTAAQKHFDVRVDAHLSRRGPHAAPVLTAVDSGGSTPDPVLSGFLDGVVPPGAVARKSSLRALQAWSYQGRLYVRTSVQLTSPNWLASKSSGETRAYALPDVTALTVSDDGVMTVVRLDD